MRQEVGRQNNLHSIRPTRKAPPQMATEGSQCCARVPELGSIALGGGRGGDACSDAPVEVLLESEGVIVVNKPCNVCIDGDDKNTVVKSLRALMPSAGSVLQFCHQLDSATSGCLAFGTSKGAVAAVQSLFEMRLARKVYLALVEGHVLSSSSACPESVPFVLARARCTAEQSVDFHVTPRAAPVPTAEVLSEVIASVVDVGGERVLASVGAECLGEEFLLRGNVAQPCATDFRMSLGWTQASAAETDCEGNAQGGCTGRVAETRCVVLKRGTLASGSEPPRSVTLVMLLPLTGRRHQLRVHMAAMGHPLVGDHMYLGGAFPRVCLHAWVLALPLDSSDPTRVRRMAKVAARAIARTKHRDTHAAEASASISLSHEEEDDDDVATSKESAAKRAKRIDPVVAVVGPPRSSCPAKLPGIIPWSPLLAISPCEFVTALE
jgi:23S rRNA-/tRNA-specific pseudouridylate synthase